MYLRIVRFAVAAMLLAVAAEANPVLMISVDGMRPGDVIEADKRGLQLPTLTAMMRDGAYASGVMNVLPTVTYPNHTTLVTGASPREHGITNNTTFDPLSKNYGGWYWYSSDIKAPTLWQVAKAGGMSTASMGWPVSVGNPAIDFNLPEYWRAGTPDDVKLIFALSTPFGLPAELGKAAGTPFVAAFGEEVQHDAAKAKLAAALIALKKPGFMTLHLASLDHIQHVYGPGSPEAKKTLEATDAMLGALIAAAKAAEPDIVIAVVSDHGFAPVSHQVNLMKPFIDAGLITLKDGKVASWEAMPWDAGGSSEIMLARPDDAALKEKVAALLAKLAADPANGIAKVIDRTEADKMGGGKEPSFFVDFRIGYYGGASIVSPLIVREGNLKGTHGYFPTNPEMRASFFIAGQGVPHKALGEIDLRDVAPTLAKILGVPFPSAQGKPRL